MKIVVKTPYFITKSGIDGFFKTDTGYELSLPGLPDTELEFSLSASESPKYVKTGFFSSFPGKIAAVAALVLFVGLPRNRKSLYDRSESEREKFAGFR